MGEFFDQNKQPLRSKWMNNHSPESSIDLPTHFTKKKKIIRFFWADQIHIHLWAIWNVWHETTVFLKKSTTNLAKASLELQWPVARRPCLSFRRGVCTMHTKNVASYYMATSRKRHNARHRFIVKLKQKPWLKKKKQFVSFMPVNRMSLISYVPRLNAKQNPMCVA